MDMQPLVSVIIPTYNREETIMRAVDSVLAQTYSDIELIVVDDGSTDSTVRLINDCADKRVRLIHMPENGGANVARNRGIAAARGEYIAFQDSDDEWDRDKLQIQIKDMLDRKLTASFCAYRLIQGVNEKIMPRDYKDKDRYENKLMEVLAERNVIGTPTLIVRKDVFLTVGVFDETMPRLQDYEFVIRLAQKEKIGYIAKPLVTAHRTAVSLSTNTGTLYRAMAFLLIKHGKFLNFNSFLSSFLNIAVLEKEGSGIYVDCIHLQEDMKKNGMDINILQYALEYAAQKCYLNKSVQKKLYENQIESLRTGSFAIYGAGDIAHEIYCKLENKRIYPKCFLVTSEKKEETIGTIPVYTIDEWSDVDIMVIVGTASCLQDEIVDILLKKKYKNIVCYPYL